MKDDDDLGLDVPDKMFFRIGEIAELVGVEPHVLRYWETEFRIRPQRSESGQRMYRRKDLAKFLRIKRLLHEQGFTIAGARKALDEGGAPAAVASAGEGPAPSPAVSMGGEQLKDVLHRIEGLRARIRDARERFAKALPIEPRKAQDDEA